MAKKTEIIPYVTSEMLSHYPDQTSFILNQVIDAINELRAE